MLDVGSWISRTSPAESAEPTVTDFQQRNSMQATPGYTRHHSGQVRTCAGWDRWPAPPSSRHTHPGMYTEMGGAGRHTLELFLDIIGHIAGIPGHHGVGVDMSDRSVMNSLSCYWLTMNTRDKKCCKKKPGVIERPGLLGESWWPPGTTTHPLSSSSGARSWPRGGRGGEDITPAH